MKQQTFNDLKAKLTEEDIEQILDVITYRCRIKTINRLRSVLTYGVHTIPCYGILERLYKDEHGWQYCAGQSYTDEIRTVRECIMEG